MTRGENPYIKKRMSTCKKGMKERRHEVTKERRNEGTKERRSEGAKERRKICLEQNKILSPL